MKIESKNYFKLLKSSNSLIMISIILYSLIALFFFIIVMFQTILLPLLGYFTEDNFSYAIEPKFIFPVVTVIKFVFSFVVFLIFALLIKKKDQQLRKGVNLEILALTSIIVINTVFENVYKSYDISSVFHRDIEYVDWLSVVLNLLDNSTTLLPLALMLFYIGVTIKISLYLLKPTNIAIDTEETI